LILRTLWEGTPSPLRRKKGKVRKALQVFSNLTSLDQNAVLVF
jgi:hypothetical protein